MKPDDTSQQVLLVLCRALPLNTLLKPQVRTQATRARHGFLCWPWSPLGPQLNTRWVGAKMVQNLLGVSEQIDQQSDFPEKESGWDCYWDRAILEVETLRFELESDDYFP
jgi:hypothetical protein